MSGRLLAPLLVLVTGLAGCGLKGPLYLPEKSKEVVVRPAPGTPPATAPEPPPADPAEASGEQPVSEPAPSGDREPPPPGTSDD